MGHPKLRYVANMQYPQKRPQPKPKRLEFRPAGSHVSEESRTTSLIAVFFSLTSGRLLTHGFVNLTQTTSLASTST